uniref:Uncharacterized protein n=1 Tax=Rhizophagus irregularis (strain DAOM 181602 / DAOM 197198 / MUCL 43194) TaxID=747089 RepID=U9TAU3_RHIID
MSLSWIHSRNNSINSVDIKVINSGNMISGNMILFMEKRWNIKKWIEEYARLFPVLVYQKRLFFVVGKRKTATLDIRDTMWFQYMKDLQQWTHTSI